MAEWFAVGLQLNFTLQLCYFTVVI